MKTFLHILPANAPQTTIPIIKGLLSEDYLEFDNRFIVYGKVNEKNSLQYSELGRLYNPKVIFCDNTFQLFTKLIRASTNRIICHSDSYIIRIIPLFLGLKVCWICWGSTTNISGSLLSHIAYPIKWIINHKLHKIITLIIADKNELELNYQLKNVIVLPYTTPRDVEREKHEYFNREHHTPLRILIGNSGHCYPWYKKTLNQLLKYKGSIVVHCMFQYPYLPEQIDELNKYGKELFSNNFYIDINLLPKQDYYKYLSSFDIYICPKPTQSGLGAIHTSLFFGKKVYLIGKNLEWEQHIGTKVYNTEDIGLFDFNEFSEPLTLYEQKYNRNLILKHWNRLSEWLDFYRSI